MKTKNKIITVLAVGTVSVAAFTALAAWKILKELGEITLDLPNDPLLSSLFGTQDSKEE